MHSNKLSSRLSIIVSALALAVIAFPGTAYAKTDNVRGIQAGDVAASGVCNGPEVWNPSIWKDQFGSYVKSGVKYYCNYSAPYSIRLVLRQNGVEVREWSSSGVSSTPYITRSSKCSSVATYNKFRFSWSANIDGDGQEARSGSSDTMTLKCKLYN